jgi:tetratricopeptide (TPR) repeat protein
MQRLRVVFFALSLASCSTAHAPAPDEPPVAQEIPITTKSPEARAHFLKGRELADNIRFPEAARELDEALKLDQDFALALVYRGVATPGSRGLDDLERASDKAGHLSRAEQLFADATLLGRRGEFEKSDALWTELAELMPKDWRVHFARGNQLFAGQKYREALGALQASVALHPDAGPAFNMIGYSHLALGESAPAIEVFKKYQSLLPNEPNAQDSLAEALMAAGQFAEAEEGFKKAVAMAPEFHVGWEGVAYTKFFAGDWAAGREALAKARQLVSRPEDRIEVDSFIALATLAEGKTADGLKLLEALAKSPDASTVNSAFAGIYRSMALLETGKYQDARENLITLGERVDQKKIPAGQFANLLRWTVSVCTSAVGLSGHPEGAPLAEADLAVLEKEAEHRPDDPRMQSALELARGMVAVAKKDPKTASAHFGRCTDSDSYCHWMALLAAEKSGDKASADASRARLLKVYVRDPVYLYARSSVTRTHKQTN